MKPMLATATDGKNLKYPLLASPKLDGVRCLVRHGEVVSTSLKPIPNIYVQKLFGVSEFNGLEGGLVVGPPTAPDVFQTTTSGVMSILGEPDVFFYVFDDHACPTLKFRVRMLSVASRTQKLRTVPVGHTLVENEKDLRARETEYLVQGFGGVMLRDPDGLYRQGHRILNEAWLLELKRFEDSEAMIMGVKKSGMNGVNMLGALVVKDIKTGITFDVGTGFDITQRKEFLQNRKRLLGKVVRYKYQPTDVKKKPRLPVFLGFRSGHGI